MRISSLRYLIKEGFKNIWSNRIMSVASIGVLVSCLLLTGASVLFSINLSNALHSIEDQNSTTVYLKQEVATLEAVQIGEKIKAVANIKNCEFYPKEEAIKKYVDVLGPLFEGLQGSENPLPNAFHITMEDLSLYDETVKSLSSIDGVDSVSDRSDVAEKLTELNNLVSHIGFWILLVLSAVSLFIISNTISVTMYSRRLEISIMKSVGATNGFIRIPFLVEGIVIGIISSLISTGVLKILYDTLINAVKNIVPFTHIPFSNFAVPLTISFLGVGVAFGVIGGMISITKYLRKEGGDIIG